MPSEEVERIRRTRRHPSPRQHDYLHLRRLNADLAPRLADLAGPGARILDIWCGTRPYDDLFPADAIVVGLDITDAFGAAELVTTEFLPGADGAYDAATCIEAWHYVRDPAAAAAEVGRIVRPGGRVLVSAPLVYEYDRTAMEHRFTAASLAASFADGWEDVRVVENGGGSISWTFLTGTLLRRLEKRLTRRPLARLVPRLFVAIYVLLNLVGSICDRLERPGHDNHTLPPNLLLTARRAGA